MLLSEAKEISHKKNTKTGKSGKIHRKYRVSMLDPMEM